MPDIGPPDHLLKRALAWLVVLVPASWGVYQIVIKSAALFR